MDWLGGPSAGRRVALGGRGAREPSRAEVLARTRAEREARAASRAAAAAALVVQRHWRARAAVRAAKDATRRAWIEVHGVDGEKGDAGCLATMVGGAAFFARPAADAALLAGAGAALARSPRPCAAPPRLASAAAFARAAAAALAARAAEWRAQLDAPRGAPLPGPAAPLAESLMALADPGFWGGDAGAAGACATACTRAVVAAAETLLPPATPPPGAPPTVGAALIATLVARCLAAGDAGGAAPLALTARGAVVRCPPLAPLAPRLARGAVAGVLRETAGTAPGSAGAAAALARWLPRGRAAAAAALASNVAAALATAPPPDAPSAAQTCTALALLLAATPAGAWGDRAPRRRRRGARGGAPDASSSSGSEMELDDEESTNPGLLTLEAPAPPPPSNAAALAAPALLAGLAAAALPDSPPAPAAPAWCSYVLELLARPRLRLPALAALAAQPTTLPHLWRAALAPAVAAATGPADPALLLPLAVAAPAVATAVATAPPGALAEGRPLATGDALALLAVARDAAWALLGGLGGAAEAASASATSPSSSRLADAALDGAASLLRALHDRNGVRPFVDEAAFMPAGLAPGRLRAALAAGGAGAARARALLATAPCLAPFAERAAAFADAAAEDAAAATGGRGALGGWAGGGARAPPRALVVRRAAVLHDALAALADLPPAAMKGRVRVAFVDEHGLEEAGVECVARGWAGRATARRPPRRPPPPRPTRPPPTSGGGLFKEFCEALAKDAFGPGAGLFEETPSRELAPAPGAGATPHSRRALVFLGRFLGKLVADGVLVELPLARFVVKALLRRAVDLHDLPSLDPELHASLVSLLAMPADQVDGLGLVFALPAGGGGSGGPTHDVPLVAGGASTPVTPANRVEFAHRAARFYMGRCGAATAALADGLEQALPPGWAPAFSAAEFGVLLGGGDGAIDVEDLKAHAAIVGGYEADSPPVAALWAALASMAPPERAAVLRFVTACGRPPLLGFGRLSPPFTVARAGDDASRLPSAATCMNLLKLPPYATAAEARAKLLLAAREGAGGFGLS